jgi:uncharacterized protein (DUF488 family)
MAANYPQTELAMQTQPQNLPSIVLTIGHSNRPFPEFLNMLQAHAVTHVIDVRKMPGSRKNPQFSQEHLAPALAAEGIGYTHLPKLGGLRRRHTDSPNTGWKNASFQGFADYMATPEFDEGLAELLGQSRDKRAALLCAEAVPWRCHRSLIADALAVRGIPVEHILSASRSQTHTLRDWAQVDGTSITYPPQSNE